MIINNIYSNHIKESNNIKFPEAINNNSKELDKIKLELIIESFFIQSYSSLTKFSFDILKKFYYSFLCFNEFSDKNNNKLENEKENNIKRDKENKYLLPEIKDKEYSLILDLDETLIYAQRNFNYKIRKSNSINKKRIILRPGLYDFLHDMKSLFEIILFSSGTPDYVDPIIKTIEKKEKYFDHILYRHHITLDENGNNVKNLDLIGRDLKKVIIIDDIPRYFHLQKENGISIKPFFGNILSDAKTLKILSNVLKKIRNDVEETKDIRISLVKYNHLLYPEVINNIEE
jgi:Dullard-like phosphatase family protein